MTGYEYVALGMLIGATAYAMLRRRHRRDMTDETFDAIMQRVLTVPETYDGEAEDMARMSLGMPSGHPESLVRSLSPEEECIIRDAEMNWER